MQRNVEPIESDVLLDETKEEAETAILKGLDYLEREAAQARLSGLAVVIGHARSIYVTLVKEKDMAQ